MRKEFNGENYLCIKNYTTQIVNKKKISDGFICLKCAQENINKFKHFHVLMYLQIVGMTVLKTTSEKF